jgi:phosphoribosylformimino-5-aminoimidazole carboxamide ribotide isomerase
VEIGGGIRTIHTVNEYINIGVKYIILGTAAVKNPNFLKICLNKYPDNITVGIDAKNDFVSTDGWTENSKLNFIEFAKQVVNKGCKRIIYTDIARDGMLSSPNYDNLKKLAESVNCEIIASGGVSCIDDIKKLIELNIPNITGVITGKALYEKKILLKDAVKLI